MKGRTYRWSMRMGLVLLIIGCACGQVRYYQQFQKQIALYEKMSEKCTMTQVGQLYREMKCFPVKKDQTENYYFEDWYGADRSYGGARKHEGIDIMTSNNKPGYFKVCSVSDGVVEQKGWLPLGGYRIGIRSPSGFYYYYAHLDAYAAGIRLGKEVKAGQILGTMGNTGYGKEGTKGKFDVHLHFGLYYNKGKKEIAINSYFLLKELDSQ